jgi:hypothetical protein
MSKETAVQVFAIPVYHVFLVLMGKLPLMAQPKKRKSHAIRSGLSGGHSVGPRRPEHRPAKMAVNRLRSKYIIQCHLMTTKRVRSYFPNAVYNVTDILVTDITISKTPLKAVKYRSNCDGFEASSDIRF